MNEEQQKLVQEMIRKELAVIFGTDKYVFTRDINITNGRDIQLGKSVGTKIGTEASQKLAVFGATPVIQASAISTPSNQGATYNQTDAQSIVTAVNYIITALKNFGITAQ
jgi:hypothetical protein